MTNDMEMNTKDMIIKFMISKNKNFTGDNIFGQNGIDSIGFLELLSFLEEEFKIELDFSEYDPKEFSTISGLSNILQKELSK